MIETFFDDIFKVDEKDPGGKKYDKGIPVNVSLYFSFNDSVPSCSCCFTLST